MSERFLLVRLGAVGDVIHTLPLAAALRDAFPSSYISWAVAPGPGLLLRDNPDLDKVFLVDTRAWRRAGFAGGLSMIGRDLRSLRSLRADVAIDSQGLIKSGFIAWASGAKVRVGFEQRHCREGLNAAFMTAWAEPPDGARHVVEKNLSLLSPLGVQPPAAESLRFPIPERAEEAGEADAYFRREGISGGRPLLVIHPGAGWETKRWEEGRFATLGDAWPKLTGGEVLLTWGPGEEEMIRRVAAAMSAPAKIAPPTDIRQMAALLRRADVFAGGDTGPLHLAAALGVACLALMGSTEPARNGPWGRGHALLHHRLACSGCHMRTCPDIECLDRIGEDEAIQALGRLWEAHEKSR
ncbi:MAG: glycosyltransferase family 9 protein [bacterium]